MKGRRSATTRGFGHRLARVAALGVGFGLMFVGGAAYANHQFPDVPSSSPFHDDVGWLTANGIASGFPDGTFHPKDPVLRQQMARFLRNFNNRITIQSHSINPGSGNSFQTSAACPVGDRALAGGGHTSATNLFITDSTPAGPSLGVWSVAWKTDNGTTIDPVDVTVWALCGPDDTTP